ncbi:MAG: hypothetical protein IPJ32_07325 [Sphingobacteriaceae bacterium]|nr:hypothetical protein [Sphingobacteriaceae bacterium]
MNSAYRFLLIFFIPCLLSAQKVDSLIAIYKTSKADTSKIRLAIDISDLFFKTDPNEAEPYLNEAFQLSLKLKDKQFEAHV